MNLFGLPLKALDGWRTPPRLYRALDQEFGFHLDAACNSTNRLAPHGLMVDRGHNGLLDTWGPGPVFCNPPYSDLRNWVAQGCAAGMYATVVMLVPADPSAAWWFDRVARFASEVRFVVGRVRWLTPEGRPARSTAGKPTAVVVFGPWSSGPPSYSYVDRSGRPLSVELPTSVRRAAL